MKHNYLFLRPAWLCLALILLALQANVAFAQSRANRTPARAGGPIVSPTSGGIPEVPDITVSPASLSETLNTGRQSTKQVTIKNTGYGDLNFHAGIVPHFAPPAGPTRVLLMADNEINLSQIPLLFARTPDIQLEVYRPDATPFTLATLTQYDVVFLGNGNPIGWVNTPKMLGDLLADYVDEGGKVILTQNTLDTTIIGLKGRLVEDHYLPVKQTGVHGPSEPHTLGSVTRPEHPFIQGVENFTYAWGSQPLELAPGGIDIAYYGNGDLLVATTPHVAVVNINLMWDNHNQMRFWDGDIDILFQNIAHYFKASKSISVSPVHGTVAPGSQLTLDVHFDATALDSATYLADLEIYSNAHDSLVTVPITLNVIGNEILFQPDTLKEALHKEQTSARTLIVTNNSPEDHTFSITDVPAYATVSPASGSLAAGASASITVNFSAVGLEYATYPDTITFDVDGTNWYAPTSLYVYNDPIIEVTTTGLHDTLQYKDESVQTFEIRNNGGSTLTYSLSLAENVNKNAKAAEFVASVPILEEHFESGAFPPMGWSNPAEQTTAWGPNTSFILNNRSYYENFAGTGTSAMVGEIDWNASSTEITTSLVTPEISTEGYRHFKVAYNANYQASFFDSLTLELQVDNGAWQPLLVWQSFVSGSHGTPFKPEPEAVSVQLDNYIDSTATSFRVRWRYTRQRGSENFWYVQIDDVVVSGERKQWLDVVPETGSIPPGGSAVLTANFDAEDNLPGLYTGELQISSNDPANPVVSIPASLLVLGGNGNTAPVLANIDTVAVTQYSLQTVVFTATDADNDTVAITLKNAPAFVTLVTTGNGTASYKIAPGANLGEYDLGVVATDSHGASDSAVFHLSVLEYGVTKFYFKNIVTGETYPTFTESFDVDISTVDFNALRLYAETSPEQVGSIKFRWDNSVANLTNTAPYLVNPNILKIAKAGTHTIKAEVYRQANGRGAIIKSTQATVRIINSSAVTSFDVISSLTTVLFPLLDSTVIDLSQNNLPKVTVRANLNGTSVKSVVFKLNGRVHAAVNQPVTGVYYTHIPATLGTYTLEATPYSLVSGQGIAGAPLTVHFQIINGVPTLVDADPDNQADVLPEENTDVRFSAYPVPVADVLHISLPAEEEGQVSLLIHDAQGRARFAKQGDIATLRAQTINTTDAGLTRGLYYIQVQYANGKREIRKFTKE